MVWLAILGLFVWLIVEHNRANGFARELAALRGMVGSRPPQAIAAPPRPAPVSAPAPRVEPVTAAVRPIPAPVATTSAPPPRPAPAPRQPRLARGAIEAWLSERGLAWIGGSALVIGGAFLVGYAAQHGFFNPAMRIAAATVLGFALVGVGEAIRRGQLAGFGGHKLAAAISAGAGAAVLYGTTWAAYGLYHFISAPVCAGLLTAIAAGLMGLAVVNGEALAVLALGGAFVAPMIAGGDRWTVEAMTLYLGILVAAGASVSWLRGWRGAAWANISGVMLWALAAALKDESWKCLLLGLEPLVITTALAHLRPRKLGGGVGLGLSLAASTAALFALSEAYGGADGLFEGALAAVAAPWLAAALVRKENAPALAFAPIGIALATAGSVYLAGRDSLPMQLLWAAQIASLCAAGFWARRPTSDAAASAVVAGAGALFLGVAVSAGYDTGPLAPVAPAVACLGLSALAVLATRRRFDGQSANEHEVLAGLASAAFLTAIAVGATWRTAPFAFAAAALGLAALARGLRWRAVGIAAAVAAGVGGAALLTPQMLAYASGGAMGAGWMLAAGLGVGAASFFAARLLAHERAAAEALRTISPIATLAGAMLALHWAAGARTGLPLDALSEAAIRTVLIAVAGLAALTGLRREREPLPFARWRAHGLMAIAAAHAVLFQGLLLNPRWSDVSDYAGGTIFVNTLAAAYLAPALLFAIAAARAYRPSATAGRIYALIAAGFAVLWALLQARSSFHGPHLAGDLFTVGAGEALGGAVALIGIVALVDGLKTAVGYLGHPFAKDAERSLTTARTIAIVFALLVPGLWSNPWFGPAAAPSPTPLAAVAMLAGYALLVLLVARLATDARAAGKTIEADWSTRAAIMLGVLAASLAWRWGFHPTDLRWSAGAPQVETWGYSALWAAMGLGFIGVSRIGGRVFLGAGLTVLMVTTAKVFIVDTASLSGVIRAGSFLALGALLLMGALTARRIARGPGGGTPTPGGA